MLPRLQRHLAAALLCALLIGACANPPATGQSAASGADSATPKATRSDAPRPKQLRANQIIVTLIDDNTDRWMQTRQALAADYRLSVVGDFPLTSIRVQCLVYEVPSDRSVAEVVTQLRADPRVESVQENQVFTGLRGGHSDMYAALAYGAAAIRADRAHKMATGRGVRVAVIDTGVDAAHPDLRGRIAKSQNFVEGGEKSFARDAHGTGVAGVIAARADDGAGIYGIAPNADLMALKACWYPDGKSAKALCSSWTIAKAVDFAVVQQAHVLNMSLSGPEDALLARLLARAHQDGISVVAAAAENGSDIGFPARLDTVIAVVASDPQGKPQQPPQPKSFVAAAPGIDIITTAPNDGYDFLSGSSLAAAHVSGVVALIKEQNGKLSPAEIARLLEVTGQLGSSTQASETPRVVDACAALANLSGRENCG
jgi:subtilisin family serine protease